MKKFKKKKQLQGKIIHLSGTKVWERPYLLLMSRNGNTKRRTMTQLNALSKFSGVEERKQPKSNEDGNTCPRVWRNQNNARAKEGVQPFYEWKQN